MLKTYRNKKKHREKIQSDKLISDMITDRQTHANTDGQTDTLIAILRCRIGAE